MQTIQRNAKVLWLSLMLLFTLAGYALAVQIQVKNGASWLECQGDASGNLMVGGIQNVTLLASAARTTTQQTANQTNRNYRGIRVALNVTAASGTGGLTFALFGVDPVSGVAQQVSTGATAVTATGIYVYVIYPSANMNGGPTQNTNQPLPSTWFVKITVGDSSSYTYSVSADLLI